MTDPHTRRVRSIAFHIQRLADIIEECQPKTLYAIAATALAQAILSHPDIGMVLGNSDGPAVLETGEPASVDGEPGDEEFRQLYCDIFDLRCDPASLGPVPVKFARAVLARWGCQPARPAEGDGPRLCWTENMPPSESCRYDHCIAETPFGRFLITWKSWKKYDSPTVDETPWGDWYGAFNSIDAAKSSCQQEFNKRLARCGHQSTLSADDIPPAVTISALLRPAYEPGGSEADGAQLVDLEWWQPVMGCDSLQMVVDNARNILSSRWSSPAPMPVAKGDVGGAGGVVTRRSRAGCQ